MKTDSGHEPSAIHLVFLMDHSAYAELETPAGVVVPRSRSSALPPPAAHTLDHKKDTGHEKIIGIGMLIAMLCEILTSTSEIQEYEIDDTGVCGAACFSTDSTCFNGP